MNKDKVRQFTRSHTTEISSFIALMILCVILSVITENFLTTSNILSVFHQVSYVAIMAVGMSFLILSGNIDLAITATLAFSVSVMGELYANKGWPAAAAILAAVVVGVGCGFLSSVLIAKLHLNAFIVTLAMMNVYRGIASVYTNGYSAQGMPAMIQYLGQGRILGIPSAIILMLAVYVIAWFIQKKTSYGLNLYAIGGNANAAQLSGINVVKVRTIAFLINGFLAALSGMVLAGRMNSTNPSMADGVEMDCIAAAVIGGTSMAGGEGQIWGTLIGALLMGVVRNGLNQLGISAFWQKVALGVVVLLAVTLDSMRRMRKKE